MLRFFTFIIFVGTFLLIASVLVAQIPESDEDKLTSEFPERVQVTIIDTTLVQLVPREQFTDDMNPVMDEYLGVYVKERSWHLPDILTPQRFVAYNPRLINDSLVLLTAYPSWPNAFSYQALLTGTFELPRKFREVEGLLRFDRQHLFDERTEHRGTDSIDNFRGMFGYRHQDRTHITGDIRYDAKDIGWLKASSTPELLSPEDILRKDVALFGAGFDWRQRLGADAQSTVHLDITTFRMDSRFLSEGKEIDTGTDVRFNVDMTVLWPFLNPLDFGASVEYFTATDEYPDTSEEKQQWTPLLRLYLRDNFIKVGPFVVGTGGEVVSWKEAADEEYQTYVQPNPQLSITTKLSDNVIWQLRGERMIDQPTFSSLYFHENYVTINPFLKPEKTWRADATLKFHLFNNDVNAEVAFFGQIIDDLVSLKPRTDAPELSWTPDNEDARIWGARVGLTLNLAQYLNASTQFTHEFQEPQDNKHILYRPEDTLSLSLSYSTPKGFRFDITGEAKGPRYFVSRNGDDSSLDDTLPAYFLWKPKLSQTFGEYITAFIGGQFSVGRYERLKNYKLPQQIVDFGVSLKF